MAEYIVEYPDDLIAEGYAEECINIHERIVRCRDCYYLNSAWTLQKDESHAREIDCYGVDPDGFCAWGKRSER